MNRLIRLAEVLGRPLWEVLSETRRQGFREAMEEVFLTGIPFQGKELPARLKRGGIWETIYVNFVYQPLRNDQGAITGILNAVVDVSELVRARQQVEQSQKALQALNQEMAAINEELRAANEELLGTQQQLQQLNQQLEARVDERTQTLETASRQTQQLNQHLLDQHHLLEQMLGQVPASIATPLRNRTSLQLLQRTLPSPFRESDEVR